MFLSLMATALSVPGAKALQPTHPGVPGTFEIVGYSGVSAQQMFLGSPNKVYIVDKTENNELQVAGHAAWASEYDLEINEPRPMDILTNAFCAGGGVLANGTWLNVGGNQAVIAGGDDLLKPCGGIYGNCDGGQSLRLLHPCVEGEPCEWIDIPEGMPTRRWYPTVEQLEDGSLIIIGGMKYGGFINIEEQNNPTYEFYPSRGEPIYMDLLNVTLPANLYPLTWLLPTGDLFIQTNWATIVFNYKEGIPYPYPDIPKAVRTYPASGGSVMLPLTPDNEYTATIMFCGGSDLQPDQWVTSSDLASYPADASCVKMSPDVSNEWEVDDFLPEGRTMGSMILLPDQTILMLNGANTGVAGYGNQTWTINDSYANFPTRVPVVYDPSAEPGSRWSSDGFDESLVDRLYHSSAILLPDGSVLVSGSNPHPDVVLTGAFQTEYAVERFYPWYYDKRRPEPQGLPETLSYGGDYFDVFLTLEDLDNDAANIRSTKAVLIRPGFSTHAINMSQRLVELRSSYTVGEDGSATLHVAQVEKPTLFPPGPGLLFITVNGVPSVAQWVMVGSGVVEEQPIFESLALPERFIPKSLGISDEDTPKKKKKSSAVGVGYGSGLVKLCSLALAVLLCA